MTHKLYESEVDHVFEKIKVFLYRISTEKSFQLRKFGRILQYLISISSTIYGLTGFGSTIIYSQKYLNLSKIINSSSELIRIDPTKSEKYYNFEYPEIISDVVQELGVGFKNWIGFIQFISIMLYFLSSTSYFLDRYYFIRKNKPNEYLEAVSGTSGVQYNRDAILECLYRDIGIKHFIGFISPGLFCAICIVLICIPNQFWSSDFEFDYTNLGIYLVFSGDNYVIGQLSMFVFTLILPFLLSLFYSLIIIFKTNRKSTIVDIAFKKSEMYAMVRHRTIGMTIQICLILLSTTINIVQIVISNKFESVFCFDKTQIWLRLIQIFIISVPIGCKLT